MEVVDADEDRSQNGKEVTDKVESSIEIEERSGEDIVVNASGDDGHDDRVPGDDVQKSVLESNEAVFKDGENVDGDRNESVDPTTNGSAMLPVVKALFRQADRSDNDGRDTVAGGGKEGGGADWSNWKPSRKTDKSPTNGHRKVEDLWSASQGAWQDWQWEWRKFVVLKDATVRVELSNCSVSDNDLPSLVEHLHPVMQKHRDKFKEHALLNLDLSCNEAITDRGVTDYLVPFLNQWPACSRLKLYKTSIGDKAIESLASWISQGHAREIHLSDLHKSVSGQVVYKLLKQVHDSGCYPYQSDDGHHKGKGPLWLRLEHNGIRHPESIVKRAKSDGMLVHVIEKEQLGRMRPGVSENRKGKIPEVDLVLFHDQGVREPRKKGGGSTDVDYYSGDVDYSDWNAANNDWHAHDNTLSIAQHDRNYIGAPRHDWQDVPKREKNKAKKKEDSWDEMQQKEFSEFTEQRRQQLTAAHEVLDAIDVRVRDADPEVLKRWHDHLEYSIDPVCEATRIARMVGGLCAQGFYGSWSGAMTPPSIRPSRHPTGPSLPFDIGPPEPASSSTAMSVAEDPAVVSKQRLLVSDISSRLQAGLAAVPASSSSPPGDESTQKREKKGKNKISSQGPPDTSASSEAPLAPSVADVVSPSEETVMVSSSEQENAEEPAPIEPTPIIPVETASEDCLGSEKNEPEDLPSSIPPESGEIESER